MTKSPESPAEVDAPVDESRLRYQSKLNDRWSSHSVILNYLTGCRGRLLDVGAASGFLAQELRARGFDVTCIEGDPGLAALVTQKHFPVVVADLNEPLPQLRGPFDVIVYGDILEHLRDPLSVLKQLNAYLSPGGNVIVSVPNAAHLWVRLSLVAGKFDYADRGILDRTHLRFFTLRSFRRLLDEAGLKVVRLQATPVPLPLILPTRYHGVWLTALHGVNAAMARAWKTMFAYQFIAVAKRGD